jgi:hypothetical protein
MRVTTKVTGSVYQGCCANGMARRKSLGADPEDCPQAANDRQRHKDAEQ